MSIRITQGMLYSQALGDVQSSLFRYSRLQQEVATGRRINRPSDDPAAGLRILPLRNDLRDLDQLVANVALARETLNTGAASLEDGSTLMARIRELTTQAANGTLSAGDRRSIGSEIEQLLNQLVGIGNSRRGDKYLFGGTANGDAPFEIVNGDAGTRVLYRGNRDSLDVEVAPGVRTALNVPGDRIFQYRERGATTFTPAAGAGTVGTGAVPVGAGDTGVGFGELQVTFAGLGSGTPSTITAGTGTTTAVGPLLFEFTTGPNTLGIGGGTKLPIPVTNGTFTTADGRTISLTVTGVPTTLTGTFNADANLSADGGETVTAVTDFSQSSVQVRNTLDGTVLNVDVRTLARTGDEHVKFEGTFDAFTTLITLRDLLQNDEELPDQVVRDRVSQMLGEVDSAHDAILDGVRELGFRSSSMDVLSNRVEGLRVARTESLSAVQDTDIAEAILDLQRQDLSYQAALQVSSRVIQTTLSSFLR